MHPKWNPQGYILSKAKKHPTIYGEKQYEETRRAPSIITFSHVKPWTEKNFSGIPSVIMINMRIGRPFVVSTHSINIYLIRKLVEGLNMLNNEYCHGFRKISYLLVVARTKQ